MVVRRLLLGLVGVLLSVSAATAGSGPFYLAAAGAVMQQTDSDFKSSGSELEVEFDPSAGFWGSFGYELEPGRLEIEAGYRESPIAEVRTGAGTFDPGGDLTVSSLMFNSFADYEVDAPVNPYFMLGVGAAEVTLEEDLSLGVALTEDSEWVIAYQLGAGLGIPLGRDFDLDLGYRYFGTDDPELQVTGGGTLELDVAIHSIAVGLRYSF